MGASVVVSILFTTGGLALSYEPNLPAGATIIVLAGATYLIFATASALRRKRKAGA
jgi:zinc transport system permease protein